jgi:hypothetical protein
MSNTPQFEERALKILGRYKGKLGDIAIWESERTGDRLYREGEIFQSQSSPAGESRLPYVKMMEAFWAMPGMSFCSAVAEETSR